MKISVHAAERFLQRVMNKTSYTFHDVMFTIKYLEKLLADVVPNSANKHFVLPEFQQYKAIYRENTILTIVPKGERHV